MSDKRYPISLNGETFAAFKSDFDSMLRQLLSEMERRESEEATISVKMTVKLEQDQARDFLTNGYDGMRDITKPTFKHEISTVMQVKNKKSGSLGGDMELVWDKDACQYIMRDINNGQVTLFDERKENCVDVDYTVIDDESRMLPPSSEDADECQSDVDESDGDYSNDDKEVTTDGAVKSEDDLSTPFGCLKQFAGEAMRITEAMGNYTVRTESNKVVLSSATSSDSPFYCPAEKLSGHMGHNIVCVGYGDGEEIANVAIECEDCNEVLFSIDHPEIASEYEDAYDVLDDEADEDYQYDSPDEEDEISDFDDGEVADRNGYYKDLGL